MDPHACADGGGHGDGLLLHHRPADPGSRGLLHQRLALAHSGRLSTFLCVLPLLMVRLLITTVSTFKMCQVHYKCCKYLPLLFGLHNKYTTIQNFGSVRLNNSPLLSKI